MNSTIKAPVVVQSDSKVLNYVTRTIVVLVAAGAAILSFDALTALAVASGIRTEFSWIWAVVIDGFIMVATFAAFALRDRGFSKYYAWITLSVFVIFSILGNAWHAVIAREEFLLPIWVAVVVTAIPPFALFLAIHLLIIMVSPTAEQKAEHAKNLEKVERLHKIQEKELERLEKLKAINEIRVQAGEEPLQDLPSYSSSTRARKPTTPRKTAPKASTTKSATTTPKSAPKATSDPTAPPTLVSADEPPVVNTKTVTVSHSPTLGEEKVNNISYTEEEVTEMLLQKLTNNLPLPNGKVVSELLGKSERTGQNFLKKFKETHQQ